MKRSGEFLKTTALGGLFVLLPVLLLYLLISELLQVVVALATPLADLFPKGTFDEIKSPVLIAVILIVAVSFLMGLAMRSEAGRRIGRWIDRTTLGRLPGYSVLKSLTSSFKEKEEGAAFSPALLISPDGTREIVYVIEDHDDGRLTVLLPWAPAAFSGFVKIVDQDQVEMLDANLADVTMVLSHWGVGVHELLDKARTGADPKNGSSQ